MKITVDRDKCVGIGVCEAVAPDLFQVREDGTLEIIKESPPPDQRVNAEKAVSVCPAMALRLTEEE